jgi:hypothetical protein
VKKVNNICAIRILYVILHPERSNKLIIKTHNTMKKTLIFLAFISVVSLLAFTACKPEDPTEGTNSGDNPDVELPSGVMFGFDGAVDWTPQSFWVGYEADEEETFVMAVGTKDVSTQQQACRIMYTFDFIGDGIPQDAVIVGFLGEEGTQNQEGNILTGEEGDLAIILFTGTTNLDGETFATGWVSDNMTVTITEIDLVNKRISANITATMVDIWNTLTYGNMGSSEEKTFTISFTNYPIFDLDAKAAKKLTKMLKATSKNSTF